MPTAPAPHGGHGPAGGWPVDPSAPLLLLLLAAAVAYLAAAAAQRWTPRGWSGRRCALWLLGTALLAAALLPPMAEWAHRDLRGHVLQHLLVGMLAPLALVAAAPATLALRSLPVRTRGAVAGVLRSRPVHLLGHPATALVLSTGGMYLLYLTPLYAAAHAHPPLHAAVLLHVFAAGYLFTWSVAGPDPAPRRPGTAVRLAALLAAAAAHSVLAKTMYADLRPHGSPHPPDQVRAAAELMYYGGDLAGLLLAVALFAAWYRRAGRAGTRRPTREAIRRGRQ
ncbi:cytochrome c oxidase assembly protein [Allonocardiopsis opalescens]|uniref:Putative membrane protein n=1 Tax=Allonocardiopsis opalescens TaxID=1144618 RepID=A0A2T0Q7N1_9ACTN|nr:cytochrome c oxidase assembly protein [Allonocardiopsis opalescens]PRX99828.1 putative membrane protein [Allonocardiopsis opalescens]